MVGGGQAAGGAHVVAEPQEPLLPRPDPDAERAAAVKDLSPARVVSLQVPVVQRCLGGLRDKPGLRTTN